MKSYRHNRIEPKWQKYWESKKLDRAVDNSKKKKFYPLIEFPFLSGDGLHVGHIRSYTALDVIARKRRAEGFNVLYPIGYDAFGLPIENFAIKTGKAPSLIVKNTAATFRRQLKSLGFSFDWSRELATSDPAYYKWTQWIFLKFLEKGLAYKKRMAINWCPKDKIGLANEEVVDGKCERCGTVVEKREKEQWMLAITKYAERLDKDLDPKKILIGTRNGAKVKMIKACLAGVAGIELVSLDDIPPVDDKGLFEGDDFLENAKKKSEFYFKKTGIPTISTDHILWIEKWPENGGFMVHIRKHANPNSPRATDDEVVVFLKNFLKTVGGESKANFHYAIAYTDEAGTLVADEVPGHYVLQDKEQAKYYWPGYPTEALLKDEKTGVFKSEQTDDVRYAKIIKFLKEKFVPRIFRGRTPVDYLEKIKIQQKNWIGRSEGVNFKGKVKGLDITVETYNSVPQTYRAETFTVIAPEHALITKLVAGSKYEKPVLDFVAQLKQKRERKDYDADKEMEGIFTGRYIENYAGTGRDLPIWVASYVVADYGTGIVNASAHDERDYKFAKKFNIPLHPVAEPLFVKTDGPDAVRKDKPFVEREAITAIVKHWSEDKYIGLKWKKVDWDTFITGGVEKGQTSEQAARAEITEETGYQNMKLVRQLPRAHSQFFHVPKNENRFAHFDTFVFQLVDGEKKDTSSDEQSKHDVVWLTPKELETFRLPDSHRLAWEQVQGVEKPVVKNGILLEPAEFKGREWAEARPDIINYLVEKGYATRAVNYKLRDWVFSRQRYWGEPIPVIHCANCNTKRALLIHGFQATGEDNWFPYVKRALEAQGIKVFTPTMSTASHPTVESWMMELMPFIKDFGPNDIIVGHSLGSKAALHLLKASRIKIGNLFLVASAVGEMNNRDWDFLGKKSKGSDIDSWRTFWEAPVSFKKISNYADKVTVILSDDDPLIKRKSNENLPTDWKFLLWKGFGHFKEREIPELLQEILKGIVNGMVPVPEKDLPVKLPKVKNYKPTDTGESPLAAIEKWVNVKCSVCKGPAKRETDTMPNWAGSSWYYLRYTDPKNKKMFAGKKNLDYWTPVDWYNGGMEHTTLHLLYSRFWHKFLFDLGLVPTNEPYLKRTSHGLILGEGGVKMSKSVGNVVNPDTLIKIFGADTVRLYEMFMGPFDQHIAWSTESMVGPRRFLEKVWKLRLKIKDLRLKQGSDSELKSDNLQLTTLLHKTIKKVGEDIEAMRFNTAVSSMMILANEIEKVDAFSRGQYEILLRLLAPFAPHIAEELWFVLGHKTSIHTEVWPAYNAALAVSSRWTLVVQVNGKVRGNVELQGEFEEAEVKEKAVALPEIKKWIEGKKIVKTVYIKGRLINIVAG